MSIIHYYSMMKAKYIILLLPLFVSSCTTTQKSTLFGGSGGAILGAIGGGALYGNKEGALAGAMIGGGIGATAGYAHGRYKQMQELTRDQQRRIESLEKEVAQSGRVMEEHNIDDNGGAVVVRIDKRAKNTHNKKYITTEYVSPEGKVIETRKKVIQL